MMKLEISTYMCNKFYSILFYCQHQKNNLEYIFSSKKHPWNIIMEVIHLYIYHQIYVNNFEKYESAFSVLKYNKISYYL